MQCSTFPDMQPPPELVDLHSQCSVVRAIAVYHCRFEVYHSTSHTWYVTFVHWQRFIRPEPRTVMQDPNAAPLDVHFDRLLGAFRALLRRCCASLTAGYRVCMTQLGSWTAGPWLPTGTTQ